MHRHLLFLVTVRCVSPACPTDLAPAGPRGVWQRGIAPVEPWPDTQTLVSIDTWTLPTPQTLVSIDTSQTRSDTAPTRSDTPNWRFRQLRRVRRVYRVSIANRPKAGASANARIVDGYIHFWESTKIRLKPGILAVSPCHTPRKGDATWCCSPSRAWARVRRGSEGGIFS